MRITCWSSLAVLTFVSNIGGQGAPTPRPRALPGGNANMSATQPVSPVALATWRTRYDENDRHTLELVVIWRGQPGWYLKRVGRRTESGGGNATKFNMTSQYGGIELNVEFDLTARVLRVQGKRVDLGENNVVLVDSVDGPGAAKVSSLLRIAPEVPSIGRRPELEAALASSPAVVSFLQCDVQLPDAQRPFQYLPTCVRALADSAAPQR